MHLFKAIGLEGRALGRVRRALSGITHAQSIVEIVGLEGRAPGVVSWALAALSAVVPKSIAKGIAETMSIAVTAARVVCLVDLLEAIRVKCGALRLVGRAPGRIAHLQCIFEAASLEGRALGMVCRALGTIATAAE